MSIRTLTAAAAVLAALTAPSAWTLAPGEQVENFSLLDQRGDFHELYYLSDMSAVVIMAHRRDCPSAEQALGRLDALRRQYADGNVTFLGLDSSLADHRDELASDGEALPVLLDETQIIGEALSLEKAGEVLVVNPKSWSLAYRGAAGEPLEAALAAVVAGKPVKRSSTPVDGCDIAFPEREQRDAHAQISYADTIAPMLIDNCVGCHHDGGIGPWAMTSYNMVYGFAPMIREVVRTRRMPPWHADPHYGEFKNDRSLSNDEVRTLVHWIEAGAPRGDGADPLAEYHRDWPEWQLGEPDLIVDIPPYEVPATGVVNYLYPRVENPYDRDVWVRAVEIIPGSRKALHHVITTFGVPDPEARHGFRQLGGLGGYVPGADADVFPAGTGVNLPANAVFQFQMHYTTFGKPVTDHSRLGIYFHDAPPAHELQTTILMNPRIRIPANTKAHTESAETVIDRDILVYNMLPHAHYRGKASEFRAYYPDGTEELLLSVPDYDFNWQTTYDLTEPKLLPAGTRIVHRTTWDNSSQNPANPDPNRVVPWGQQSWDEMLFGAIRWRFADDDGEPGNELAQK